MSATLRVDVTQELIDQATERDSRRCMIAEAIKEAHPHFERLIVDLQTIRWTNPRTKKRYVCLTPERAALALVAFDQGEKVEPFSFNVKPSQTTPVIVRERKPDAGPDVRGEAAYKTQQNRGRKRVKAGGTIEGGRPRPTGHLSNVKISRNDVRLYGRRLLRA